jgi:hypothetical protein
MPTGTQRSGVGPDPAHALRRVAADGTDELLMEASGVSGEVSLALCAWNGATFSVLEDDDCANFVSDFGRAGAPKKLLAAAPAAKLSEGPGVPLAVVAGLGGVCALLEQVAADGALSGLAAAAIDAVGGVLGALHPQQMLGPKAGAGAEPLEALLLSIATAAAGRAAEPEQAALLCKAAASLLALASARGSADVVIATAAALARVAAAVSTGGGPLLVVELPPAAVALERSVRARLGVATEPPLPEVRHCTAANVAVSLAAVAPGTCCFACDGAFVYTISPAGVHKLGSGSGGTDAGHAYAHNGDLPGLRAERAWVGLLGGLLLLRPDCHAPRTLVALDAGTLARVQDVALPGGAGAACSLFVAGGVLHTLEARPCGSTAASEEPEPEAERFEPEPEGLVAASAGPRELVVAPCLEVAAGGGCNLPAGAQPRVVPLALEAVVLCGRDEAGADLGCLHGVEVTAAYKAGSKFKAGDRLLARKRPLGFANFHEAQDYPAAVLKVNADGTLAVKYDDEERNDPSLPLDKAKHAAGDGCGVAAGDKERQSLERFCATFFPVQSRALRAECAARLAAPGGPGFDVLCDELLARLGRDPREKIPAKTPAAVGVLPMEQVAALACTESFDCLRTVRCAPFNQLLCSPPVQPCSRTRHLQSFC